MNRPVILLGGAITVTCQPPARSASAVSMTFSCRPPKSVSQCTGISTRFIEVPILTAQQLFDRPVEADEDRFRFEPDAELVEHTAAHARREGDDLRRARVAFIDDCQGVPGRQANPPARIAARESRVLDKPGRGQLCLPGFRLKDRHGRAGRKLSGAALYLL